jgi:hypothetical protein
VRGNQRRKKVEDDDFFGEEETSRPGIPSDTGDPLWTIYAINPGLPFRVKVEKLMLMWELDAEEIAAVLKERVDLVQTEVSRIETEWMSIGEPLTDEELQRARGKMIKELLQHKAELEGMGPTQDSKIITMKISLSEKLAKLRGLDREKKQPEEGATGDAVADLLSAMTPEKTRDLLARLDKE